MKYLITSFSLLLLVGCATQGTSPTTLSLKLRLQNPLVAERYWSEMAEHMADFVRSKNPILKDPVKAAIIEGQRTLALQKVEEARKKETSGISGSFVTPESLEDVHGQTLLTDNTLYFDTTFITYPGPSIHVYLTTVVDPRDVAFPDTSSIDLGALQIAYGAQQYPVSEKSMNPAFRTAVLFDTQLMKTIGFAQLSK